MLGWGRAERTWPAVWPEGRAVVTSEDGEGMEAIRAIRGMNDILPDEIGWWQRVERTAHAVFACYGYREIRTPLMEKLELFARSIGESTDIVEKEMYSLQDSKGQWLALRPEATASIIRAYIQHNLKANPLLRKFFAIGPMFRHERPQKGRYRQFHQIDVEAFGIEDPRLDAEMMTMLLRLFQRLGVRGVRLHMNSLGCSRCRGDYRHRLQDYLAKKSAVLCPDCDRRRHVNPLRVFDCKVERCQGILDGAPVLLDAICSECREHFDRVRGYLEQLDTRYVINPRMVRGLDYYMRTTFEVITERLGAQNAVGGGGRYDGLMRDLGGPDLPGIGFAVGIERLILLLQQEDEVEAAVPDLFVASLGDTAATVAFGLVQELRGQGLAVEMEYGKASLKAQMRRAGKMAAGHVLIIGDDELQRGVAPLRNMGDKTQVDVPLNEAADRIVERIGGQRQ